MHHTGASVASCLVQAPHMQMPQTLIWLSPVQVPSWATLATITDFFLICPFNLSDYHKDGVGER